jgi:hypothetical protein
MPFHLTASVEKLPRVAAEDRSGSSGDRKAALGVLEHRFDLLAVPFRARGALRGLAWGRERQKHLARPDSVADSRQGIA